MRWISVRYVQWRPTGYHRHPTSVFVSTGLEPPVPPTVQSMAQTWQMRCAAPCPGVATHTYTHLHCMAPGMSHRMDTCKTLQNPKKTLSPNKGPILPSLGCPAGNRPSTPGSPRAAHRGSSGPGCSWDLILGAPFWGPLLGGPFLGTPFGDPFWGAPFKNPFWGDPFWGAPFGALSVLGRSSGCFGLAGWRLLGLVAVF